MTIFETPVRNKVPEILRSMEEECVSRSVEDEAYLYYLEFRLIEEVEHYLESKDPEDLIDLMEVVERVASLKGITADELKAMRAEKTSEIGDFSENVVISTEEGVEPSANFIAATERMKTMIEYD
jgi:predicted house-cleaning noncanonical NTP pyrophosphatase (MazG superfamily)